MFLQTCLYLCSTFIITDLAVGAYLSGHAVVLKTRPVVTILPSLVSDSKQISIDTRSLNVSACIKYEGVHVPSMLHVKLNIIVDKFYKRVYFSKNRGAIWEVTKQYAYNTVMCEIMEITVTVRGIFKHVCNIMLEFCNSL